MNPDGPRPPASLLPPSDPALDAAILAYLADAIEPDALAALDRRLRDDPAAAQRFAELSHHDVLLGWALRTREGHPDHPSSRFVPLPRRAHPSRHPAAWQGARLAALVVLVVLLGAGTLVAARLRHAGTDARSDRSDALESTDVAAEPQLPVVADVLVSIPGARVVRGTHTRPLLAPGVVRAGDRLSTPAASSRSEPGDGAVAGQPGASAASSPADAPDASTVVLRFPDGTELALGADTVLALEAPGAAAVQAGARGGEVTTLNLAQGRLDARVAHQDAHHPLQVVTPQALLQVVGTRLSVTVADTATRLTVSEGRVQMSRLVDGVRAEVAAGQYATALATVAVHEPLVVLPLAWLDANQPVASVCHFRTSFADEPDRWPGALDLPQDTQHPVLALRTLHDAAGIRRDVRIPVERPVPPDRTYAAAWVPSGPASYVRLRYRTERITTGAIIDVQAIDRQERIYHCRLLPRLDGSGEATLRLDRTFLRLPVAGQPAAAVPPEGLMPGQEVIAFCVRLRASDDHDPAVPAELFLEEIRAFTDPGAVACTPTMASAQAEPAYQQVWDFDHADPPGITVLRGTWQHLAHGGVADQGCMETTSPYFVAALDVPPPTVPVRITLLQSIILPAEAVGYSVFVQWEHLRTWTFAHRPTMQVPDLSSPSGYGEVVEYLSDHHMEHRLYGERSALSFCDPVPGARLLLLVIGHNRLSSLRIESVDPDRMPSIAAAQRAVAGLALAPGKPVVAPLDSDDPQCPYTVEIRPVTPGRSPWIHP